MLISLLIALVLPMQISGCKVEKEKTESRREESAKTTSTVEEDKDLTEKQEMRTVILYFGDENSEHLRPEKREIPQSAEVGRAVLEALIKGPQKGSYGKTIPEGTKVLGVQIKDGIAYADFSEEIAKNHPGGSAAEIMTVYSVVNTLTELPSIKKVKFLINGKETETLVGHFDLSQPVERNKSIIKE